ncbi:uncharacterized protein [Primulina eburnea]
MLRNNFFYSVKKMSVTFPSRSQDSVTSKYVVPLISLLSDEEGDDLDHPPAPLKTENMVGLSPSRSSKERAASKKPFEHVAHMYKNEVMKHFKTKKRGCTADTGVMKKRAVQANCVPVVIIDTSTDSSG